MSDYIAIIDLGTGSIRTSLYDEDGQVIAFVQKRNNLITPQVGWAEQDPTRWWSLLKESFKAFSPEQRQQITAISVTSQREGIVPVDRNFEPLANIIIWLDGRTKQEGCEIELTIGKNTLYDICGLVPNPTWSLSKILWLRKHQTVIYEQTFKFLQASDYIVSRLSGRAVSDFSIASRTCMLNVCKKRWSTAILKAFDIDENKLPELLEPGSFVETIRHELALELGLPESVKIFTGAGDQQAAAIGVGAFDEGVASIGIGTSSAISMTIEKAQADPKRTIILNCAGIPGKWEYEPPIWNTGGLIKWFHDKIEKGRSSYESLLKGVDEIAPGAEGLTVLPYFSGAGSPRWHPSLKGAIYGLNLAHDQRHILRAIHESIAFEIRLNIEQIRQTGIKLKKIILSGGASRNLPLCRIVADVLQSEVAIFSETEASSRGTFFLVKAAMTPNKSLKQIAAQTPAQLQVIEANPKYIQAYNDAYQRFVDLGDLLTHLK